MLQRVYPFQVALEASTTGLPGNSKDTEQVRSVAVERVGARVGALDAGLLQQLDDALRLHLTL